MSINSQDEKWEYDIEETLNNEYKLRITLHTKNRLMLGILDKSKKKLKKRNLEMNDHEKKLENVNCFKVEGRFLKLINLYSKKFVDDVNTQLERDGDCIKLLDYEVYDTTFIRDKEITTKWNILIDIKGFMADNR